MQCEPEPAKLSGQAASSTDWSSLVSSVIYTQAPQSRRALLAQLAAAAGVRAGSYDYLRALDHLAEHRQRAQAPHHAISLLLPLSEGSIFQRCGWGMVGARGWGRLRGGAAKRRGGWR